MGRYGLERISVYHSPVGGLPTEHSSFQRKSEPRKPSPSAVTAATRHLSRNAVFLPRRLQSGASALSAGPGPVPSRSRDGSRVPADGSTSPPSTNLPELCDRPDLMTRYRSNLGGMASLARHSGPPLVIPAFLSSYQPSSRHTGPPHVIPALPTSYRRKPVSRKPSETATTTVPNQPIRNAALMTLPPCISPKSALHYEVMFQSVPRPTSPSVVSFPSHGAPENRKWDGMERNGSQLKNLPSICPRRRKISFETALSGTKKRDQMGKSGKKWDATIPAPSNTGARHPSAPLPFQDDYRVTRMLYPLVPNLSKDGSREPVDGSISSPPTDSPRLCNRPGPGRSPNCRHTLLLLH